MLLGSIHLMLLGSIHLSSSISGSFSFFRVFLHRRLCELYDGRRYFLCVHFKGRGGYIQLGLHLILTRLRLPCGYHIIIISIMSGSDMLCVAL